MERSCVIEHITQRRVDQAYPLAAMARPRLTLEEWRQFCASRTGGSDASRRGGGILAAVTPADYLRGLCSYEISRAARPRPVLCIDLLAFAHVLGPGEILDQMLDEVEAIAASRGCQAIEIQADDLAEWLYRMETGRKLPVRVTHTAR